MNTDRIGTDYRPIACASYDQYEVAILHRRRLRLVWDEGNVTHDQVVTPLDLHTTAGEEYLVIRLPDGDDGKTAPAFSALPPSMAVVREVRLDRIRRVEML